MPENRFFCIVMTTVKAMSIVKLCNKFLYSCNFSYFCAKQRNVTACIRS